MNGDLWVLLSGIACQFFGITVATFIAWKCGYFEYSDTAVIHLSSVSTTGTVTTVIITMTMMLAACTAQPPKQIVKPEVVQVVHEIRTPTPAEYIQDRNVVEPQPLCKLAGPPVLIVFCQDQVANLVDSYRAALRESNLDKAALRQLQPETP